MNRTNLVTALMAGALLIGGVGIAAGVLVQASTPGQNGAVTAGTPQERADVPTLKQEVSTQGSVASITVTPQTGETPGQQPPGGTGAGLQSPPSDSLTKLPPVQQTPPLNWPSSLPLLEDARLLSTDVNGYQRYDFLKEGSVALIGGNIVSELTKAGWTLTTTGTPRSATLIGELNAESVSVNLRDNANGPGWVSIEYIYLQAPPAQQPRPNPTETKNPLESRG